MNYLLGAWLPPAGPSGRLEQLRLPSRSGKQQQQQQQQQPQQPQQPQRQRQRQQQQQQQQQQQPTKHFFLICLILNVVFIFR